MSIPQISQTNFSGYADIPAASRRTKLLPVSEDCPIMPGNPVMTDLENMMRSGRLVTMTDKTKKVSNGAYVGGVTKTGGQGRKI